MSSQVHFWSTKETSRVGGSLNSLAPKGLQLSEPEPYLHAPFQRTKHGNQINACTFIFSRLNWLNSAF